MSKTPRLNNLHDKSLHPGMYELRCGLFLNRLKTHREDKHAIANSEHKTILRNEKKTLMLTHEPGAMMYSPSVSQSYNHD